jgi:hypothetical protein
MPTAILRMAVHILELFPNVEISNSSKEFAV